MFATQLLRILQTLPADAKYDPCAFDSAEVKLRMKEEQNGVLSHSDDYCKSINTKDLLRSNTDGKVADPLAVPPVDTDDFWDTPKLEHYAVLDDFADDARTGIRFSPPKDDPSDVLFHISGNKKDANMLTSDRKDIDKLRNTPESECPTIIGDRDNHNKPDSQVSGAPCITPSELYQADTNLYTDKTVLECDLPELMVCYKEINYHVVKDICVDDGIPVEDKGLIDRHIENSAGACVSLPSTEYGPNKTQGGNGFELIISDDSEASLGADVDDLTVGNWGTNNKRDVVSHTPSESICLLAGGLNKNGQSPEVLTQIHETNAGKKSENDVLEEESLVTSLLPLKKYGTRSFLRSFMDSLDKHGDEVTQHSEQSVKTNLESLDEVSEAEESNQTDAEKEIIYNRKVDNGIITFDFSSEPTVDETSGKIDDVLNHIVMEQTGSDEIHQESILERHYRDSNNPFISSDFQSSCVDRRTVNILQETEKNNYKGRSSNPFADGDVISGSMEGSTEETHLTTPLNHKVNFNPFANNETEAASIGENGENSHQPSMVNTERGNCQNPFVVCENADVDEGSENILQGSMPSNEIVQPNNPFAEVEVLSSSQPEQELKTGSTNNPFSVSEVDHSAETDESSGNANSASVHDQSLELKQLPNEGNQGECADGEGSFSSVSGRITYSGPITCSGSISLRSDSSTTSTRSFAFPVLQCEWNSSPVRMVKADRRHFRKHRGGWKQGILCCRF